MKRALVCSAILLSACASASHDREEYGKDAPLADGVLRRLQSDSPAITGGLGWSGTITDGVPCTIYGEWVRVEAAGRVIWIPRERVTYLELGAMSR